ncbi:MAG: TatD family hydrolase [Pseudomonadales bacterium]|jgi:TatD DNase family protein|nr:TatD family hydrolase [Pseudomonadales bacterium]
MTNTLIDIGANLTHESFAPDLDAVLSAAWRAGLSHIIVTGSSRASSREAAALAKAHPGRLYSTAGVHPHEASHFDEHTSGALRDLYALPEVVAVGETGLDYNRNYSPVPDQERVFAEQLALAAETQLPVFLHQRDAHSRFLPILKEQRDQLSRAVVHCFTGTREELSDYLDLDLYIGITGWICDERRGQELQNLVKDIPRHRLLLETDAPYLQPRTIAPRPKHRRNVPEYLPWVLAQVAVCTGREAEEIARETTENARVFFGLDDLARGP